MRTLNAFLLLFTVLGLVNLFDCSDGVSGQELIKKIKDTVLLYSNLIRLDYVKHLLYHPFHRLHKKHLLHRQRKQSFRSKHGQNVSGKRTTNKRQSKRRLTGGNN